FEVYEDVKSKTEKALNFYSQLFTIIGTLEKTIANMEEVFAKLKSEDDEKKKRAEEEIASKMMQASLQEDFPNLPTDLSTPSLSTANVPSPISTPENSSSGRPRRPRLGDYMDFYRNKMGNSGQRPITHPATQSQEVRLPEPAISMQSNGNFVPVASIPPQMPNQIVGPNFSTPPNQLPTHVPTIQQNLPQQQIQPTSNTAAPIGHPNAYHQGQAVQPHPTSIPNPHMNVTYSMQTPQMSVPISMANPSPYGHMPQENTGQPQQQFPMSSGIQPHSTIPNIHNTSMQPGNVLVGVQQGHFPAPSQLQSQTPAVHSIQAYHAFSSMPTGQNQQIQSGHPTQQMQSGHPTQQMQSGHPTQQMQQPGHPIQQMQPGHPTQQIQSGHPTQQMQQPGHPTQQIQSGHPTQQMQHQIAALPQHSSTSSGHGPSAIFGQQFQQPMNIQQQQPTYMQPTSQHPQQIHSSMPQAITGSVLPQAPTQSHAFDPKSVIASQQSMSSNWAQHASMASMSSVSAANTMVAPSKSPINMPSVHPQNNMPRPQTPTSNPSIQNQSISPWHRNIPTSTYNTANNPHPQQSHPQFQQFQRDAATPASPFQPIQPAPAQTAVHFNPIQEANPPISASPMQHIPNPPVQQIPSQMHPNQNLTNQNVVVKNSNLDLLSELFDDQLSATPVLAPSPVVTKQHNVGSTPPSDEKAANFQHLYNSSLNAIPPQQPAMSQFLNMSVEKEQKLERNHYMPSLPTSSPRPAATVLPIVQPSPAHSNPSVSVKNSETNTSCLCITNVSSVSHAGEHSQQVCFQIITL
uniref:Uncharacterized protein n=1 Tax=Acrobeloides nanus TaxID=290746 RepID=A0A914CXT5_9BILA